MAGTIIADTLQGTTTTETVGGVSVTIPNTVDMKYVVNGSAKAWAGLLDQTGTAVDSFNVSSFFDNGTGNNKVNYASAFANNGYSAVSSAGHDSSPQDARGVQCASITTISLFMFTFVSSSGAGSSHDQQLVCTGDLA